MATKKEKRAEVARRRAEFEEEQRQSGLKAQAADRKRRAEQRARREADAAKESKRLENILAEHKVANAGKQKQEATG